MHCSARELSEDRPPGRVGKEKTKSAAIDATDYADNTTNAFNFDFPSLLLRVSIFQRIIADSISVLFLHTKTNICINTIAKGCNSNYNRKTITCAHKLYAHKYIIFNIQLAVSYYKVKQGKEEGRNILQFKSSISKMNTRGMIYI